MLNSIKFYGWVFVLYSAYFWYSNLYYAKDLMVQVNESFYSLSEFGLDRTEAIQGGSDKIVPDEKVTSGNLSTINKNGDDYVNPDVSTVVDIGFPHSYESINRFEEAYYDYVRACYRSGSGCKKRSDLWDFSLNYYYDQIRKNAEGSLFLKIQESQRRWISERDLSLAAGSEIVHDKYSDAVGTMWRQVASADIESLKSELIKQRVIIISSWLNVINNVGSRTVPQVSGFKGEGRYPDDVYRFSSVDEFESAIESYLQGCQTSGPEDCISRYAIWDKQLNKLYGEMRKEFPGFVFDSVKSSQRVSMKNTQLDIDVISALSSSINNSSNNVDKLSADLVRSRVVIFMSWLDLHRKPYG